MKPRRGVAGTVLACLLLAAGAGATAGCGDGEQPGDDSRAATNEPVAPVPEREPPPPAGEVTEPAEPGPPEDESESEAARAARAYLAAIDSRDASAACALLAPGALRGVRGVSGPCPEALTRAIGRPPAGGAPAWDGTRIEDLVSVAAEEDRARVTLEVFHRFSDRKNPSVEDDVIFLELRDGRWLVSQADATLYRAVGYPEPPLRSYVAPGD